MAAEKINIENFLNLAKEYPVIDVRSPGEFNHAQIPGAYALPLFTDDERKMVGTTYKQQSREAAIKIVLDFFGVKMIKMVEDVETLNNKTVLVHCWRGGMRSGALAWLLDMYGFKVYTLSGGYKAFRNWVLKQFGKEYNLKILGGYTGSGKTLVLQEMKEKNYQVIDLENLANHKGSAFGAIGEKPQPSQEMFENLLAVKFHEVRSNKQEIGKQTESNLTSDVLLHTSGIWLEDESQRIGRLIIPNILWEKMRASPVYFLDIPFEERLNYLVSTYGSFEKVKLAEAIERIQKRLGGLETKSAINFLSENNIRECFSILLKYYDKLYHKGLHSRKNYESLLNIIPCPNVNSSINANKLSLQEA